MKKILYYIAAMAAMVSCADAPVEELTPELEGAHEVSVSVNLPTSRVAIGEDWSVTWEENDTELYYIDSEGGLTKFQRVGDYSPTEATFSGTASSDDYNLLYGPMNATISNNRGKLTIGLTNQAAGAVANLMLTSSMIPASETESTANMIHLGSVVELQLSGLDAHGITAIDKIEVLGLNSQCSIIINKAFEGQSSYEELTKSKITIKGNIAAPVDGAAKVRFNILPTLLAKDDVVEVKIYSSGGNIYFEKFTLSEAMAFERATYNTIECADWTELGVWSDYTSEPTNNQITSAEELAWLAKSVNDGTKTFNGETYTLTTDIDLTAHEWVAIGNLDHPFQGTFDGAGHTISGLYINRSGLIHQGLFGHTSDATIKNLSVSGEVTGRISVGGVVGCSNTNTTVINCHSSVKVSGTSNVGGVVGYNEPNTYTINCYNSGEVSRGTAIGGIVGHSDGTITNCYNSGKVSGSSKIGGIVGENRGTATDCYWDNEINNSGIGAVLGDGTGTTTAMTTAEMQSETFRTLLSFNSKFYNNTTPAERACPWEWTSGYPTLNFNGTEYPKFSGGDGTLAAPYKIASRADLDELAADVTNINYPTTYAGNYFVMTGDVDLGGTANEFTRIGNSLNNTFSGIFDGAGHAISGLYINQPEADGQALFGYTSNATIKNLSVSGEVTGETSIAGVVGNCQNSTLTNCNSSVEITGKTNVAGVVGYNYKSTVTNCYSSGAVSGTNKVAGVVGHNHTSTISNCYSSSKVIATGDIPNNIAGVVGYNTSGTITNCYWNSTVNNAAGFKGVNSNVGDGTDTTTSMTTPEMQSDTFATTLNTNAKAIEGACGWRETLSGFPTLLFGADPASQLEGIGSGNHVLK